MTLHPKLLGLAGGIVVGAYILAFTLLSVFTGYGHDFLANWIPLHPGYDVTVIGSLIGFVYGFIEGFLWLFIFAHVSNFVHKKCGS